MASLQDIVNKNKKSLVKGPGGHLTEESQENVQTLAGRAGLQSAPLDPASTATIGGNPHQQKMAGSPAQAASALRMAQDPSQSLANTVRTQQARTQQTDQEKQGQEKSQALQDLGQLGDRVNQLIEGQRQKLVAQAAPQAQQAVAAAPQATGLPTDPAKLTALKNDLKTFQQNPNDMEVLLRINEALGRQANTVLAPAEIAGLYESSVDAIARAGSDTLDNDLQVEDLIALGNFPYQAAELSSLLNVPEADISKYSVVQLRDALNKAADQEFTNAQQLEQQATSTVLGSAERAQARGLARESSATGQRASEADVARLEQQLVNVEIVSFGGTQISVDELLKDETISGIISDYLNAPEGSELRRNLETTEPQLVQFIKSNEAVLDDAAKAMGAGATEFANIQKDNEGIGQIGGQQLDPELLKAIIPGFGTGLNSSRIDTAKYPILAHLKNMDPAQAEEYVKGLTLLPKQLYSELASLTPDELKQLGLENPEKAKNVKAELTANWDLANQLAAVNPQDGAAVLDAVTDGAIQDPAKAQDLILDNIAAGVLGLDKQDLSFFDADGDGRLDDGDKLIAKAQAATPRASLKSILGNNVQNYKPNVIEPAKVPEALASVFDKVRDFASDGEFTPVELKQANLTEDEMYAALDSGVTGKWGPTGTLLNQLISAKRGAHTTWWLNQFALKPTPPAPKGYDPALAGQYRQQADQALAQKADLERQLQELTARGHDRRVQMDTLKQRLAQFDQSANILREYADTADIPTPVVRDTRPSLDVTSNIGGGKSGGSTFNQSIKMSPQEKASYEAWLKRKYINKAGYLPSATSSKADYDEWKKGRK